jgi:uncharacterized SAM-dependent methyltransferase
VWNSHSSRIEMHLVSLRKQTVALAGEVLEFAAGEHIVTEHCHKYTVNGFASQAARAGWRADTNWLDDRGYFSVNYLEAG